MLTVTGLLVTATLSMAAAWRLFSAAIWALISVRQVLAIANGYKHYQRLRLDAGGRLELLRPDGSWVSARLLSGSVVLANFAWLRFVAPDGRRCAELVRGNMAENEAWRRFQVIWRHLGGVP